MSSCFAATESCVICTLSWVLDWQSCEVSKLFDLPRVNNGREMTGKSQCRYNDIESFGKSLMLFVCYFIRLAGLVGRHAYLGLEFDVTQTWTWNDNTPLQFSNWEVSLSSSSLVSPRIAVVSGRHKTWTPLEESGASAHVICQMIRELFSVCVCVAGMMFC